MALSSNQKQEPIKRLLQGELIGKQLKVVKSTCKDLLKVQGEIIDETTNTFVVRTPTGQKRIPKSSSVFLINGVQVDGRSTIGKPEDRTKKILSQ